MPIALWNKRNGCTSKASKRVGLGVLCYWRAQGDEQEQGKSSFEAYKLHDLLGVVESLFLRDRIGRGDARLFWKFTAY